MKIKFFVNTNGQTVFLRDAVYHRHRQKEKKGEDIFFVELLYRY